MNDTPRQLRSALVVEDEVLVALYVEDLLIELGYEVVAVVHRFERGLSAARDGKFDFAVLDLNLDGKASYPIADALKERGIPFLFATGYDSLGNVDHRDAVRIQKPFRASDLAHAIARL
jgi:DNA-binding response OmpR family regulator